MILTTPCKYSTLDTSECSLRIDSAEIEIVSEFKYLGFMLDSCLNFGAHFPCRKICKKLYFFSRVASYLSVASRISIYYSTIQPHFDYCATVLYPSNLDGTSALQKLRNIGIRLIPECYRNTSAQIRLGGLRWLLCQERIFQFEIHNSPTRGNDNLYLPKLNHPSTMNCLFYKGLRYYNELHDDIKEHNL
ncbi:hypothetical protein HHI36_008491 [Cryptolaemus montrouzieri]|uniref:Uncharacterized protein n=1 Tax=Cryptolaemus montrouzieri TaxID=559131 RepID=A0ABD2MSR3_9CUCU